MVIDFDLEEIIFYLNATEPTGKYCNNIENLKNKLLKAEKLEKAWEVVKEKNVEISWLKVSDDLNEYNVDSGNLCKPLTQEEFKLIKEMIENAKD